MDLQSVLKKTKERAEKVKVDRPPPSIATQDRPYEAPSSSSVTISLGTTESTPKTFTHSTTETGSKQVANGCLYMWKGI